jgi:hypothetical protein
MPYVIHHVMYCRCIWVVGSQEAVDERNHDNATLFGRRFRDIVRRKSQNLESAYAPVCENLTGASLSRRVSRIVS